MKILFYSPYSLDANNLPVLLDEAMEYLQDPTNTVWFITCDGEIRPCLSNAEQSPIRCLECKFSSRWLVRQVKHPNFVHKELSSFTDDAIARNIKSMRFEYKSIDEVKSICHQGVNIGLGVVSSYVTLTRNLDPAMNRANRSFINDSLRAAALLVELTMKMVDTFQPDLLCLFNGRFNGLRPVLETSLNRRIKTAILECTFSTSIENQHKVRFVDKLPQDIENSSALIEENWRSYSGALDKEAAAAEFFIRRRKGEMASDNVYTSSQDVLRLPQNWDPARRNFVIFNSSEDEFFCVGESFDRYKLFSDQVSGIKYLAEKAAHEPSIHFYLRIHPNLRSVKFSYHLDLLKAFKEYPNITVIPADSPISTYKLIDHCEKVFVFGSSAGVESAYWGKPVVLMGGSLYMNMDVAYYARTLAELDQLLFAQLESKPRLGALKYALFLFGERGEPFKYVNFNYRRFNIGGKILAVPLCFAYKRSLTPYVIFSAVFRTANLIPHLLFKKLKLKNFLVERSPVR
jgi:hypothetical protein